MHGPELVGWMLVVLCGGVGAYHLPRLRGGTPGQRRAAAGETLMGFGMAVMALPASAVEPLPPPVLTAVFGGAAAYELALALRGPAHRAHHLHHAVGALAMVHMALAMAAAPAGPHGHHAAAAAAGTPVPTGALTGVLLAYFALYVLRTGARLVPAGSPDGAERGARGGGPPRLPEAAVACRPAMGIGMFAMLLTV